VNALNRSQLKEAAKRLNRNQPLVVVNEGLFQYLSPEEMRTVVGNIRELLSEFQGSWITSDFSIKDEVNQASAQQRNFRRIVTVATGHKMYNNAFDSLEQLLAFLRKMGLKAAVHNPLDEIGEIVSLHRLHLSSSVLDPVKASLRLWVLS
jgi:O-methyltransferase involved in polyketide biosynthesis